MKDGKPAFGKEYGFWRSNWVLLIFLGWFTFMQLSMSNILVFGVPLERLGWRVDYIAMVLLMVQILFFQHYSRRELILTAILTAVFAFAAFHSQERMILVLWLFLAAAKEQDLDRILKLAFFILLGTMLVTVTLSLTGVIRQGIMEDYRDGMFRYSLGYSHPNVLGMCVQLVATLAVYLRRKKLGGLDLLLCVGAVVFIYFCPQSRSSVICTALLTVLVLYCMVSAQLPVWLRKALLIGYIILPMVCGLLSVYYSISFSADNSFLLRMDVLLSGRLSYGNMMYLAHPITLFGSNVSLVNSVEWPLDNSYFFLLLQYGIIPFLCFYILYFVSSFRIIRSGNELLAGIITIYSIHAMAERSQVELWFNVFTLFFLIAVYQNTPAEAAIRRDGAPIWDE